MALLAAAGVDPTALGNITPASAVIYSGPDLSNTSFNGGSPSVGATIATDDMVLLAAATVPLTGVIPGTSTYNQSMISAAETLISSATTGGGGDAFTQPFINTVTSYISQETTTGAGGGGGGGGVTPASVLGHIPSTPLEKVVEISAPDADQSQIWAITNNGQQADSATTFVQSENINFEANPNMDLQIGPSAQTVYKVGAADITQGSGPTVITLDANETYALSTTGTGANVVHTVQKVVAETGGGAPAGSYKLADGAQPITITSTTANTLDDNTVMGIYQPEYFLKEKVVASDSFAEQTVTLTLDSMLGDDQNLFWQINVDPNDPNSAQLEDFVETHGVVEVASDDTSVDITIKVRNDGDQDEGNENFKVDLGYVVGPNKIENVKFDLMKEDNTVGDTQAIDITPTLAVGETLVTEAPAATGVEVNATPDVSSYSTTLTDSNTDGTIDSITVDLGSIGKGTIDIIGTDSIGNKLNMSSLGADGEISATDLEFAASGSNAYLSQASVNATIKGDPLEYYVFSGNSYHFLGMDFLGNVVKKNVQKTDTDVKSFSSIQEALTDAVTNVNVSEIRVAVNHDEQGSNTITIGKEDLKIDFWDEWDGSAAENHNAGSVLNFKLGDGIKSVEFGGIRDVNVTGNEEDNYIIGNDGNNKIYGGAGDDVLLAGDGNDTIKGGSGDDVLDGQEGADKVYGQRGDDIVVATGSEDLTALDLISGGSGDDVLVDAANKTSGEVVIVAGSGNDTISFGASRTNVDYQDGAPVSENTYTDRQINAHLIDLSKNDKLDLKGITSVVEADLPTTLLTGTDASGLTKTALTVADDITPRSSFDATENEYEIDLGIVGAKGLVATGLKIDDVDTNGNGSTTEAADEIAAPILAVSGEIEISLGSTSLVSTAMVNNSGNTYGVTQAVFDGVDDNGDGDFDDALDEVPLRELYGVNDNLIWIDTIA